MAAITGFNSLPAQIDRLNISDEKIDTSEIIKMTHEATPDAARINKAMQSRLAEYMKEIDENEHSEWELFKLYECFSKTEKYYGRNGEDEGFQFSLEVHQLAFQVCKKWVEKCPPERECIFSYLANHPQMDRDKQTEIFTFRLHLAEDDWDKADAYNDFICKAHIDATIRDEAMRGLFALAANREVESCIRKNALSNLPHIPHYTEIPEQTRLDSVHFLCDRIQDEGEKESFRLFCAKNLCYWFWSRTKTQTALLPSQQMAVEFLERFLETTGLEDLKKKVNKTLLHYWGYHNGPAQDYLTGRMVTYAAITLGEPIENLEYLQDRVINEEASFIDYLQLLTKTANTADKERLAHFVAAKFVCTKCSHFAHLLPDALVDYLQAFAQVKSKIYIDYATRTIGVDVKQLTDADRLPLRQVIQFLGIKLVTIRSLTNALTIDGWVKDLDVSLHLKPEKSFSLFFPGSYKTGEGFCGPEMTSPLQLSLTETILQSKKIRVLEIEDPKNYPTENWLAIIGKVSVVKAQSIFSVF